MFTFCVSRDPSLYFHLHVNGKQYTMEPPRKRPCHVTKTGEEMQDFLDQLPNQQPKIDSYSDISQTLQNLEEGITDIRASLDKPKEKRVNLKEINRKIDSILQILNSWNTAS